MFGFRWWIYVVIGGVMLTLAGCDRSKPRGENAEGGKAGVKEQVVINEGSWVRLCSRGAVRLCIEDNASNSPGSQDTVTLYHCLDNATEGTVQYAGRPLYADRGVVFSMEFAPAIDHIITQYPRYVPVVSPRPLAILHKLCAALQVRTG